LKKSTEKKLIDAATQLIWEQGVNKTTVDQICARAGISKMTFYRAYDNKFDIVKTILDRRYELYAAGYEEIFSKNLPFLEKINEIIYFNMQSVKEVSQELIRDIVQQENKRFSDYMRSKVKFQTDLILKYIHLEQKKGNFRTDVKSEFISFFIEHINELIFDERLQAIYESTDELLDQLTRMFYFGVIRRQ
jgi:AcrR family transcriptional regulator